MQKTHLPTPWVLPLDLRETLELVLNPPLHREGPKGHSPRANAHQSIIVI